MPMPGMGGTSNPPYPNTGPGYPTSTPQYPTPSYPGQFTGYPPQQQQPGISGYPSSYPASTGSSYPNSSPSYPPPYTAQAGYQDSSTTSSSKMNSRIEPADFGTYGINAQKSPINDTAVSSWAQALSFGLSLQLHPQV